MLAPGDVAVNILPLRGVADGHALWWEAPNTFVADWVKAHLPIIEPALWPHTSLPIRVGIG